MPEDGSVVIVAKMNISAANKELAKLKGNIEKTEDEITVLERKRNDAQQKVIAENLERYRTAAKSVREMVTKDEERAAELERQINQSLLSKSAYEQRMEEIKQDIKSNEAFNDYYPKYVKNNNLEWDEKDEAEIARREELIKDLNKQLANIRLQHDKINSSVAEYNKELTRAKENADYYRNLAEGYEDVITHKDIHYDLPGVKEAGEKYDEKIADATFHLEKMKERAGQLAKQINEAEKPASRMSEAFDSAQTRLEKFSSRLSSLAVNALVFTTISKGLRAFSSYIGEVIKTNSEAQASLARLKAALLTLAQPIVEVVIPAFTTLINILTKIVTKIAQLVSMLFGKTIEESAAAAKNLYDEQQAIEGVGEAAEEAQSQLAGFDEINTIQTEPDTGLSSGGAGGAATSGTAPDFAGLVNATLSGIEELFVGTALLALGCILAFSGASIPLGLGLMAIGAVFVGDAIIAHWGEIKEELDGQLGDLMIIIGVAALAIGAVLAFSGASIPLGLGLMVAGAVTAGTAIAARWDAITGDFRNTASTLMLIAGAASLAIGLILLFTGVATGVGIALVLAGVGSIGGAVALNWDYLPQQMSMVWDETWKIYKDNWAAVGEFLSSTFSALWQMTVDMWAPVGEFFSDLWANVQEVAVTAWEGISSFFSDTWQALSSTATTVWNSVAGFFSGIWSSISSAAISAWNFLSSSVSNIWKTLSNTATTVWNAISNFFSSLWNGIRNAAVNAWNFISNSVSGIWNGLRSTAMNVWNAISSGIMSVVNGIRSGITNAFNNVRNFIVNIFTSVKTTISNIFNGIWNTIRGVINSILGGVEGMANGVVRGINSVIRALNKIHFSIPSWVPGFGGKSFGFNIGTLGEIRIPRLAQGTVVPPNREFMAVLGDNKKETEVVSPLSTMKQALAEALRENGGNSRPIQVNLVVNGRTLAKVLVPEINDMTREAGKPVLLY